MIDEMANLLDKYIRMTKTYGVVGIIPTEHIESLNTRANIILDRYENSKSERVIDCGLDIQGNLTYTEVD